jgi:hypothetical protein
MAHQAGWANMYLGSTSVSQVVRVKDI